MEIIFYFIFSQIHSFTEVVQKVQISNVDLDTHTEVCLKKPTILATLQNANWRGKNLRWKSLFNLTKTP